jgi:hypothetical protein
MEFITFIIWEVYYKRLRNKILHRNRMPEVKEVIRAGRTKRVGEQNVETSTLVNA